MNFRDKVAPLLLFVLAILLGLNLYTFNDFQLNAFNIGAFFLTLTGLNQGSIFYGKINIGSLVFKNVNIGLGIFMIILVAFASGFKYYEQLENFVNSINTNALLLMGIAVTLWSFKLSDERQDIIKKQNKVEKLDYKEKFLNEKEKRIKYEENNKKLTTALKEANKLLQQLEERGNRNE
ncbi:hypothetical protein ACIQ2D_18210 [Lysinibacillus sp. NPDC097287]|uniref:hypothetical protein n=1 Tax=Lysinibacillus sp. NPDC097287 TaxID=3364144 RepID=UPI003822E570